MRKLTIEYLIPEKLANKLIARGINFAGVDGRLLIGHYKLGEPSKVTLSKKETA